jgi:hypothetical protein
MLARTSVLGSTDQAPARARLWPDGRGNRIIPLRTPLWPHCGITGISGISGITGITGIIKRNSLQVFGGWLDLHWSGWVSRGGQNERLHMVLNLVSF